MHPYEGVEVATALRSRLCRLISSTIISTPVCPSSVVGH